MRSKLVVVGLFFAGCAGVYSQNPLPVLQSLPDKQSAKVRPSVYIDATYIVDRSHGLVEAPKSTDKFRGIVTKVTREAKLFNQYTLDTSESDNMDYSVKMELLDYGDLRAGAASLYVSGMTLGIVPGSMTGHFKLRAKATDRNKREVGSSELEESITTWTGPLGIFRLADMTEEYDRVIENMVKNMYQKMLDQQWFQYE
jgi:hypothetical protein